MTGVGLLEAFTIDPAVNATLAVMTIAASDVIVERAGRLMVPLASAGTLGEAPSALARSCHTLSHR